MPELKKTALFCVVAVALAAAAVVVDPGAATPEIFSDQGELFYPDFTDPQAPKAIEVVAYDEDTATARPLKVEFRDNKWIIPSHHSYPADAETRLAKTAAALMELRKDIIVSDNIDDHAEYGVIDPLDQTATSLVGRGKHVTLRDANGKALADFIVGKNVEDKPGYRYMRVPGQRRTYAVKTDAEVSAEFKDWIETDLLKLASGDVRKVLINRYSINERQGTLENLEKLALVKNGDKWSLSGGGTIGQDKINALTGALEKLRIVDVQPKPEGLSKDLKTTKGIQLTAESYNSLRGHGFFINQFTGQLLSNEGEITVETANGLQYTLRFGEIAGGGSAAAEEVEKQGSGEKEASDEGERRYVFITVDYSQARAQQYAAKGKEPDKKGQDLAEELRTRFADWYYVISGADFNTLRPSRRDLRG
jgi:Domain of unknown function (DUF4340)